MCPKGRKTFSNGVSFEWHAQFRKVYFSDGGPGGGTISFMTASHNFISMVFNRAEIRKDQTLPDYLLVKYAAKISYF